ncbi:unnamed protein product [Amaranthus hypochondriacus]
MSGFTGGECEAIPGAIHQGEGVIHVVTPLGQGEALGGVILGATLQGQEEVLEEVTLEATLQSQGEALGGVILGVTHLAQGEAQEGTTIKSEGRALGEAALVVYQEVREEVLPIRQSVEVHMIVAHQEVTLVTALPPDQGLFHDLLLQDPLRHLLELDPFCLEEPLFLFRNS